MNEYTQNEAAQTDILSLSRKHTAGLEVNRIHNLDAKNARCMALDSLRSMAFASVSPLTHMTHSQKVMVFVLDIFQLILNRAV